MNDHVKPGVIFLCLLTARDVTVNLYSSVSVCNKCVCTRHYGAQ